MSAIITRAIVQQFLVATVCIERGTMWYSRDLTPVVSTLAASTNYIAHFPPALCARLGVLASAELLFSDMAATKAEQGEDYEDLDGHDVAIDDVIRHRIDRLIRAADVDPKAWAAARKQ